MVLMNVKNIFCNVEENKINSQLQKIILKHVQYGNQCTYNHTLNLMII